MSILRNIIRTEILVLRELYHQHKVRICGSYELLDGKIGILMTPVADCDLRNYLEEGFSMQTSASQETHILPNLQLKNFYSKYISCKRKVLHLFLMVYMLGVALANEPSSTWLQKSGK